MDYQRIYDELITYRKENVIVSGYSEKHHIVMRSLEGSDDESNLVRLTAREHYVAHLLLARFNRCSQTAFALWMMQCKSSAHDERPSIKSSRMYEWARKEFIKYASAVDRNGTRNSQHGTRWICNIDLQENKKISKTDELPQGWILGRNKWKEPKKKPRKGYSKQKITKMHTLSRIAELKIKYPFEGSHSLFKQISEVESISIRTLYTYWGYHLTVRC